MKAGTAELRNHLSYFLKQVRRGIPVVVLDRGCPVAQLVPIANEGDLQNRIAKMIEEGLVTAKPTRSLTSVTPVKLNRSDVQASSLVSSMRDDK
ncbi:MAG: type II toxin-antitoxin system prevent-host-death family antitoxin [Deltaproteobacteria bacterium]|nr:type II toxin-antitoxin system prevent-host-death family antitoxin [Deltaproteobacteria bacterium]